MISDWSLLRRTPNCSDQTNMFLRRRNMKYGHTKTGLKKNDLSISSMTFNSRLSGTDMIGSPYRNEETRDHISPEGTWASLRFRMNIS